MFRNDRLRQARAKRKLTQEEVADRVRDLGVSCTPRRVSKWERGEAVPSAHGLVALTVVLHVRATELVDLVKEDELDDDYDDGYGMDEAYQDYLAGESQVYAGGLV